MHSKANTKSKEYYIDARMSTAKKNKKNREKSSRNNNTSTPISHSVSYNHHKYQKYQKDQEQKELKRHSLSSKQMKMMIRCLQQYCTYDNQSCQEVAQKYKITSKIFDCLQNGFQLIGDEKQKKRNKDLLDKISPPPSIRCEYCQELGRSCNDYQSKLIRSGIEQDLQHLEEKLLTQVKYKEELLQILKSREEYQDEEFQLQELKRIVKLQKNILKEFSK